MLGEINKIEYQVLDVLKNPNQISADELSGILNNLNYATDSADIAVCQWNNITNQGWANSSFFKNFGFDETVPFSESYKLISESFFKEDLDKSKALLAQLEAGIIDHFMIDLRQHVENKIKWWRHFVTIKDADIPQKQLFTAVSWNVTAEKESIEKLKHNELQLREQNLKLNDAVKKLESAKDGESGNSSMIEALLRENNVYYWEWNVKSGVIGISLPFLQDREDLKKTLTLDKFLEIIYHEDIAKIQLDKLSKSNLPERAFNLDLRVNYTGKEYNWFEFRGRVLEYDDAGIPSLIKGLALDIQKRKTEAQLELQLQEKTLNSERMRNTILTNITNELRTPLQSILGFSDILEKTQTIEEQHQYIEAIKKNSEVLLNLIGGVSEHADGEYDKEELHEEEVAIWEYLVELQQVYAMKISGPVRLVFTNSYDNCHIMIDKGLFAQVLERLLSNSIKNTSSGYISYGYEIKDDKMSVVINDTGAGFVVDELNGSYNLSENKSADDLLENVGLTLTMCRNAVHRLNGEFRVNSKPGAGSSYIIDIPVKILADELAPENSSAQKSVLADINSSENNSDDRPTLLVAEDVMFNFMMMKTLLEDRYNVVHAENGEKAVELFASEHPVFVFMDIKMPVMDGLEATRRIRKMSTTVPIVVLTAYAVRSLKKEAAEAGCTDILTKPATSKQINATVRKYLKQ